MPLAAAVAIRRYPRSVLKPARGNRTYLACLLVPGPLLLVLLALRQTEVLRPTTTAVLIVLAVVVPIGAALGLFASRREGRQRTLEWTFFAFAAVWLAYKGVSAVGRGDRWYALLASTLAVASALCAVRAYRGAHRG